MTPYLVRVIDTHLIVGIFCVEDMTDLHYWVDSVTDPGICEYRRLESGGVVWESASPVIPAPENNSDISGDDDPIGRAMKTARLTEGWDGAFYDGEAKWRPMGPMRYGPVGNLVDGEP